MNNKVNGTFNTVRVIYALASFALAVQTFKNLILIQKAYVVIFIPAIFALCGIIFVKKSMPSYCNQSRDEMACWFDEQGDRLGFLMVIIIFSQACGVKWFLI